MLQALVCMILFRFLKITIHFTENYSSRAYLYYLYLCIFFY